MAEERTPSIVLPVLGFELRLLLGGPVFAIVVAISALMVLGSLTVERIQVGPLRAGFPRTAVDAVLYVHMVWSLFFLFTAAAFAGATALRDAETGFGSVVRSTPASGWDIGLGRAAGCVAAVLASFVSVPVAIMLAPYAPWTGGALPRPDPVAILYGTLVFAAPNLILATALFLALASRARSAVAVYTGAVALLVLYGLGQEGGGAATVGPSPLAIVADPFGFAAFRSATAGWSEAERASGLPPLVGAIGLNRIVWLLAAAGAFGFAVRVPGPPRIREARRKRASDETASAPPPTGSPGSPSWDAATAAAQLGARTRLEFGLVVRSPFLPVLLGLGTASVAKAVWPLPAGTSGAVAAARVDEAFRLVPIVVAAFWAGELVWGERDGGLGEIVGATGVPDWILVGPKVGALCLILAASFGTAALAGAVVGWARGLDITPAGWVLLYALPRTADAAIVACLAVFLQAIAPGKLAGFGLIVLYLIASLALESAGLAGDLYRYGGSGATLAIGAADPGRAWLVRLYWSGAALVLTGLAHVLIGRGLDVPLGHRLRRLPRTLRGGAGLTVGAGLIVWAISGIILSRP